MKDRRPGGFGRLPARGSRRPVPCAIAPHSVPQVIRSLHDDTRSTPHMPAVRIGGPHCCLAIPRRLPSSSFALSPLRFVISSFVLRASSSFHHSGFRPPPFVPPIPNPSKLPQKVAWNTRPATCHNALAAKRAAWTFIDNPIRFIHGFRAAPRSFPAPARPETGRSATRTSQELASCVSSPPAKLLGAFALERRRGRRS